MTLTVDRPTRKPSALRSCYCGYLHSENPRQKVQTVSLALVLLSSLFATELIVGAFSHSLSLLADAGHLFADIAALGMTLIAVWIAQRPATGRSTFGHKRVEILAALLNGLSLLAIAAFVIWESVNRFHAPQTVLGLPMLIGATIGLGVNSLNLMLLHQRSQNDLNLKAAFLHVLADAASSVGVIAASLTIYFWHWMWMDATASLLVAGLTSLSALPLIKESLEILLEYAPSSIDPTDVETSLMTFEPVTQVDHLRIWSITSGHVALNVHLHVLPELDNHDRDCLLERISSHLSQQFLIQEITLQIISEQSSEKPKLHPFFTQSLTSHVLGKTRSLAN
ncbi:cation transporter [Phormidesmis priestleyi ULC007]|uniref:Cation transporter n=1 Tax=Phormidesmis priestleyi ULC007 TaxID=1920490 RepID=A0A2T1D4Z9_9CYAN|nr:cation diffusion facilitator family transporter [Phormidesmis priestleyi]PSB15560.1 cation transporter [Phormidesmis priestleyi ULC007]PZO46332.1 MAG: cation transporter [Phormidesmis priestleyi]